MDDRTLARWRTATLRLDGVPYPSARGAVSGLLAVQAENHRQASWAVATRTTGLTEARFAELFDAGEILRTHVLRPTWHFVTPDDIRWLVELTAPRIKRTGVALQRSLEVTDAALDRAVGLVVDALTDGSHLTRAAIGSCLARAGLPVEGPRLGLIMAEAELRALVCSGRMDGNDHTYALLEERAPAARRLDREQAVAELVLRYFTGHGPATERDLAYWATLPLSDVRAGLAAVRDQLDHLEHDGRTYWFAGPPPDVAADPEPRAHLLLVLDEYHNGFQDSRHVLDADGIVPRGRPANVGMSIVDTQMVGDMRRSSRTRTERFRVGAFRPLAVDEVAALEAAGERYGRFLGRPAEVEVIQPG